MREFNRMSGVSTRRDDGSLCAESMRKGSQSFHAAAILLPRRVRLPAQAVYAFCRAADDLVDDNVNPHAGVAVLNRRLDAIYADAPENYPEDRAFSSVVHRFEIPREIPQAMLEGFLWDAQNRTYVTSDDVLAYAARVAATVGTMMAILMNVRDRHALARACELGLAMQLTNIARDVGQDARNGRVYLPMNWLRKEGLSREQLISAPQYSPALARVVQRLLDEADRHYQIAMTGLAGLPFDCRIAISAAAQIYRAIGSRIATNGFDSVNTRAATSKSDKIRIVLSATSSLVQLRSVATPPPARQIAFLVDAASASRRPLPKGLDAKVERFFELLHQSAQGPADASRIGGRSLS